MSNKFKKRVRERQVGVTALLKSIFPKGTAPAHELIYRGAPLLGVLPAPQKKR